MSANLSPAARGTPVRGGPGRSPAESESVRRLAERALSRAAGAPLVAGNALDLLIDAEVNFAAWLEAIAGARDQVLLENYIIRDDRVGRQFRDALIERARSGVRVRVIHDWLGCLGQSRERFWAPLHAAGGEVRVYNRFRVHSPFGWISRDHRKLLVVDRSAAFLGGLCLSARWLGDSAGHIAPWRDTAVRMRGPALLECEQAFADIWNQLGEPMPLSGATPIGECGDVDLRVIATQPDTAGIFRLDQLIAAMAQRSLWISDAYFVGIAPYVQALKAAAQDGVDVRLLVPGTSDLPIVRSVSLSGYRPLLESGIRVFEWNGSMMHAKTAVADARWARVGSSNLNIASWIGNCEIDVAVEHAGFAAQLEQQYLSDLENATELVLSKPRRRGTIPRARKTGGGSTSRAAAGALRLAHSVGAAIGGNHRVLEENDRVLIGGSIGALLLVAAVALIWPRMLAWPLAALAVWFAIGLAVRAVKFRRAKTICAPTTAGAVSSPAPDLTSVETK